MATRVPTQKPAPQQTGVTTKPCGNQRPDWDVVGRVNDLVNCYIEVGSQFVAEILRDYVPQIILALVLIAIMVLAGKAIIEG